MFRIALALLLAASAVAPAAAQVNVDALVRKDRFKDIVISPDGTYYAVSVPSEKLTIPRATATAEPELEPPGTRLGSMAFLGTG